jgi:hypothetical protein
LKKSKLYQCSCKHMTPGKDSCELHKNKDFLP